MKARNRNTHPQVLFQELSVSVNEVIGTLIALMDQRVFHLDRFDSRHSFLKTRQMRIVEPEGIG